MDSERRERVNEIFELFRLLPKAERDAELASLGGDDTEVIQEVQSLLQAYDNSPDFLNLPALEEHSEILKQALDRRMSFASGAVSHYKGCRSKGQALARSAARSSTLKLRRHLGSIRKFRRNWTVSFSRLSTRAAKPATSKHPNCGTI